MGWVRECEMGECGREVDDMEGAIVTVRRFRTSRQGVLTSKERPKPPNTGVVWVKGQTLALTRMGQLQLWAYRGHLLVEEVLMEAGCEGSEDKVAMAVSEERTTPQDPAVAVLASRKWLT
jgi:hypothetical protein